MHGPFHLIFMTDLAWRGRGSDCHLHFSNKETELPSGYLISSSLCNQEIVELEFELKPSDKFCVPAAKPHCFLE